MPLTLIVLVAYVLSIAFEGPLRTVLSLARVEMLLYVRDLAAFCTIAYYARPSSWTDKTAVNLTSIAVYALACHSVLGLWLGHPLGPALFAIKLFLALLFGLCVAQHIHKYEKLMLTLLTFIFVSSTMGVFINKALGTFPWEGDGFDTVFGTVKTTNVWWSGGERRLPGFSRASFTVASIMGISGVFLSAYSKSTLTRITLFAIGMPAIYLTTSKGIMISYMIVSAWTLLPQGQFKSQLGKIGFWFFVLLGVALPLLAALLNLTPNIIRTAPANLSSFADRFSTTWPEALLGLDHWHLWITGQGVGGVSGALRYGSEAWMYNPIDNLFLYCFMNFGILGAIYYGFFAYRTSKLHLSDSKLHRAFFASGFLIFSYGVTAHMLEDAFISITLGMLIALYPKQSTAEPS